MISPRTIATADPINNHWSGINASISLSYGKNVNTNAAASKINGTAEIKNITNLLPATLNGRFVSGSIIRNFKKAGNRNKYEAIKVTIFNAKNVQKISTSPPFFNNK